MEATT
jgi:hypothetical protein